MSLRSFYSSTTWKRFRETLIRERIARDGALYDDYDGHQILAPYDAICHHVIPLTESNVEDVSISLNPDNIQVVSHRSHDAIHQRFGHFQRHVYLVLGAPKSGKSTWVDMTKREGDLVCDMGDIYACLGAHGIDKRLSAVAFAVRDVIFDSIRTRNGKWLDAYVIGTYRSEAERARMVALLDAEEVFIDTPIEECLRRCNTEEERGYVVRWFDEG